MVNNGDVFDSVPAEKREKWSQQGYYRDIDIFSSFELNAKSNPDALAIIDEAVEVSYSDLMERSLRLASGLRELGIDSGDVVAVNLPNGWKACAVDMAVAALGAIVLPYPIGRRRHETHAILKRSKAKVLICNRKVGESDYLDVIQSIREDLPFLSNVVVDGLADGDTQSLDNFWTKVVFNRSSISVDPNAAARIIASSGTESEPKLVVYSHNSLVSGQAKYLNSLVSNSDQMRALFCVPLSSPFGSLGTPCLLAAMGGTIVSMERFNPDNALRLISIHKVTHVFAGPNMVDMLLNSPILASENRHTLDFSAVRAVISGGSALTRQTVEGVHQHLGCAYIQSYGSADGVACHTNLDDDIDTTVNTVGCPSPEVVDIRIVDYEGNPLPAGTEGEIIALGPMTPMCYFSAPELNSKYRLKDGWVFTGDHGSIDEKGRLKILGRRADTIVRNGIKVNLAEIEILLRSHQSIASVSVVDISSNSENPHLCACIIVHAGFHIPSVSELNIFITDHIGAERSKTIDHIENFHEFPVAPSGKVDRVKLVDLVRSRLRNLFDKCKAKRNANDISAKGVIDLLMGVERAGVLRAAIELNVFDIIGESELHFSTVADQANISPRGARILLNALAGLGLLQTGDNLSFKLAQSASQYLVSTSKSFVGGLCDVYTADLMWEAFVHFKKSVISGSSHLTESLESPDHCYWQQFASGIKNTSRVTAGRIAKNIVPLLSDVSHPKILDMGCSNGIYGFTLASLLKNASVTGLDWPSIRPHYLSMAENFSLLGRVHFEEGSIFDFNSSEKYDAAIISQVLHHFDENMCKKIVETAFRSLRIGGIVIVADFMISRSAPENESIQRLFAAQMLALTESGDCYSVEFNKKLLEDQGFSKITSVPLRGLPVYCVIGFCE
ncbi:AMP-binding protein [Pseudomonas aeruginosa]